MAKRKAASAATKRGKTRRTVVANRRATSARTKAARTRRATARATGTAARRAARPAQKATAKARTPARPAPKKATARKTVARKPTRNAASKKAATRRAVTRTPVSRPTARVSKPAPKATGVKVTKRAAAPKAKAATVVAPKKAPLLARGKPALDRVRKTVHDDDTPVTGAPSSLDFDHRATSARSGRRHMAQHDREQAQTDPGITAGDVDADWESAETVGDEAPGGDNQTPDQDAVEENGEALGLVYEEAEELDGEGKISARDTDRWELDPESSDDFDERD